jgi:hypothetical protein
MKGIYIILSTAVILHFVVVGYYISKIIKTHIFNKSQKRLNIMLTILLPFIWVVLIYYILKSEPSSYEVAVKNDKSSNGFHKSGIGIHQAGTLL